MLESHGSTAVAAPEPQYLMLSSHAAAGPDTGADAAVDAGLGGHAVRVGGVGDVAVHRAEVWKVVQACAPHVPRWSRTRPFLSSRPSPP